MVDGELDDATLLAAFLRSEEIDNCRDHLTLARKKLTQQQQPANLSASHAQPVGSTTNKQSHLESLDSRTTAVILRDGRGNLSQYNGSQAQVRVQSKRNRGGWANVSLLTAGQQQRPPKIIKWRSRAWDAAATTVLMNHRPSENKRSFLHLPDTVFSTILEFLYSKDFAVAARSLSLSCKKMATRVKQTIGPMTRVKVNLRDLDPTQQLRPLIWLAKYRFKIEELVVTVGLRDLRVLAVILPKFLNVSELKSFRVFTGTGVADTALFWNVLFPMSFQDPDVQFLGVQKDGEEYHGRTPAIDHPLFHTAARILRNEGVSSVSQGACQLCSALAATCPALETLAILIPMETDHWASGVFQLFARRSLKKVHIRFSFPPGDHLDDEKFSTKLREVVALTPQLEDLTLSCPSYSHGMRLAIRSISVRTIDVVGLSKCFFFDEVDCPSLESFACRGSYGGNGVRPSDPSAIPYRYGEEEEYVVGEHHFLGMKVPSTCIVRFQ